MRRRWSLYFGTGLSVSLPVAHPPACACHRSLARSPLVVPRSRSPCLARSAGHLRGSGAPRCYLHRRLISLSAPGARLVHPLSREEV